MNGYCFVLKEYLKPVLQKGSQETTSTARNTLYPFLRFLNLTVSFIDLDELEIHQLTCTEASICFTLMNVAQFEKSCQAERNPVHFHARSMIGE